MLFFFYSATCIVFLPSSFLLHYCWFGLGLHLSCWRLLPNVCRSLGPGAKNETADWEFQSHKQGLSTMGQVPSNCWGGLPSISTVSPISWATQSPWRTLQLLQTRLLEAQLEKGCGPHCAQTFHFWCDAAASPAASPAGLGLRAPSLAQPFQRLGSAFPLGWEGASSRLLELGVLLSHKLWNKLLLSHAPHWPSKASLPLYAFHSWTPWALGHSSSSLWGLCQLSPQHSPFCPSVVTPLHTFYLPGFRWHHMPGAVSSAMSLTLWVYTVCPFMLILVGIRGQQR